MDALEPLEPLELQGRSLSPGSILAWGPSAFRFASARNSPRMEFTLEVRTYRQYLRDQANLPIASSTVRVRTSSNDLHLMNSNCLHDHTLSPFHRCIRTHTRGDTHTHTLSHTHTLTHARTAGRKHGLLHTHTCPSNMPPTATRLPTPATIGVSLCGLDSSASPETALGSQARLRPVRDLYPANRTFVVFASLVIPPCSSSLFL